MDLRDEITRFSNALDKASALAVRDLEKFWSLIDFADPVRAREAVLDFVPKLVAVYGDVAGAAALQWYEEIRAKSSRELPEYTPTISPGVPEEDIHSVVRAHAGAFWEGDPKGALEAVKKGVDTWVKYSGRDTIARNVKLDPAKPRFARVPSGKTCAFCSMLASRGWVYHSRETAGAMSKFHAHCDCQIVPSWEHKDAHVRGFDPDAHYERYLAARAKVESEGGDPENINEVMAEARRMFPSYYKDGVGEGGRVTSPRKVPARKGAVTYRRFESNEQGMAWARKHFPPLEDDSTGVVGEYTGPHYERWNRALRREKGAVPEEFAEAIRNLDELMSRHRLPEAIVLHRGTDFKEFLGREINVSGTSEVRKARQALKKLLGKERDYFAYTSTSIGANSHFAHKPVQVRLKVPAGIHALNPMKVGAARGDEREIILERNLKYRIDRMYTDHNTGKTHVTITILPKDD